MATQIFIEPELETLHENSEEWVKVCNELGLVQQLARAGTVEKVGNPYLKIDPRSERVYKMLCPCSDPFTAYEASTIPLDILQEINRCHQNAWFDKIEIWYDDKSPDPFVVGNIEKVKGQYWNVDKFLIARWGDELLPFEQLVAKAIQRFKNRYKMALVKLRADCDQRLQDVEGELQAWIDVGENAFGAGFDFPRFQNPIR